MKTVRQFLEDISIPDDKPKIVGEPKPDVGDPKPPVGIPKKPKNFSIIPKVPKKVIGDVAPKKYKVPTVKTGENDGTTVGEVKPTKFSGTIEPIKPKFWLDKKI